MALEIHDGKVTGSSGVAQAGLTLGIIGTGLAVLQGMNNGNGLGGIFGGSNKNDELEAELAQYKAIKYTDDKSFDLYEKLISTRDETNAKIGVVQTQLYNFIMDLDKRTALNEQAQRLNREYDTAARDYMFTILNNKIDCCCEKTAMQSNFDRQLSELSDAAIISYVSIFSLIIKVYKKLKRQRHLMQ